MQYKPNHQSSHFEGQQNAETAMSSIPPISPGPDTQSFSMPSAQLVAEELAKARSMNDFWGKDGIFSRLFAKTMEQMLEAEMTHHVGYDKYDPVGRNNGNNRNGSYSRTLKTSGGTTEISMPRDRNGTFRSDLLPKYATSSNEIEDKIVALYAKGNTTRDIQDLIKDMYGMDISPSQVSSITDKVIPMVTHWQARPLEPIYTMVYLDAIHIKIRRENTINNVAIYVPIGITIEGKKDVLGHWVGNGAEGAKYWLEVVTDLKNRGVQDILIASVDGLTGFSEAINTIYSQTFVQRCIVHQIRSSCKYILWKDRKVFATDLKLIYQAATKEEAEMNLLTLSEKWSKRYASAVSCWERNWEELSFYFEFTPEIRRLIYTTNPIESYNRQLRKVIKTKSVFPTDESVRKILYLANQDITKKWIMPIRNWASILNQLVIKFGERLEKYL